MTTLHRIASTFSTIFPAKHQYLSNAWRRLRSKEEEITFWTEKTVLEPTAALFSFFPFPVMKSNGHQTTFVSIVFPNYACVFSSSERGTCCDAHKPQEPMRYKQTPKWLQSNRNGYRSNVSIVVDSPCLNDCHNGREVNHENLVPNASDCLPKKITTVSPSPESENILWFRSHGLVLDPRKEVDVS